jgi:diaminopimelate decarboxylase
MNWTDHTVRSELFRVAREQGTPFYIYDARAVRENCRALVTALADLKPRWYYAVKANPRKAMIALIHGEGFGAEVVSIGEAFIALSAGVPPDDILFNGNAKTPDEVREALARGIRRFNFDSIDQWELLEESAGRAGAEIAAFVRLNPDVAADHPHLSVGSAESKFGLSAEEALSGVPRWKSARRAKVCGVHCHTGSQFLTSEPLAAGARAAIQLFLGLRRAGLPMTLLNLGGGFGVPYNPAELTFPLSAFALSLREALAVLPPGVEVCFEPGRAVVADAGALVAAVVSIKHRGARGIIAVDAGMTENIRPPLYGAYHHIYHLGAEGEAPASPPSPNARDATPVDIVGPVCESGDFLALGFPLAPARPTGVRGGDLVLISHCGAYSPAMQSNYNSRTFPPEFLLEPEPSQAPNSTNTLQTVTRHGQVRARMIRARQPLSALLALEP